MFTTSGTYLRPFTYNEPSFTRRHAAPIGGGPSARATGRHDLAPAILTNTSRTAAQDTRPMEYRTLPRKDGRPSERRTVRSSWHRDRAGVYQFPRATLNPARSGVPQLCRACWPRRDRISSHREMLGQGVGWVQLGTIARALHFKGTVERTDRYGRRLRLAEWRDSRNKSSELDGQNSM